MWPMETSPTKPTHHRLCDEITKKKYSIKRSLQPVYFYSQFQNHLAIIRRAIKISYRTYQILHKFNHHPTTNAGLHDWFYKVLQGWGSVLSSPPQWDCSILTKHQYDELAWTFAECSWQGANDKKRSNNCKIQTCECNKCWYKVKSHRLKDMRVLIHRMGLVRKQGIII